MANIGKNIRILRQQKNMTQDELAEQLFVSRQTVSNYETGRSQPDIDTLLRIAEVLGVEAQTILYGTPDTPARLAEKKRAIAACFGVVLLAVLYHLLTQLREAFLPRLLFGGLTYSLALLLRPALFLLAGWALMQLISVLTTVRPLEQRQSRWVFWGLLAVLAIYAVLVLPLCLCMLWSDLEVLRLHLSGSEYSYSRTFSVTPRWDAAVGWIARHIKGLSLLFPLAGVALWLTGSKRSPAAAPEPPSNAV